MAGGTDWRQQVSWWEPLLVQEAQAQKNAARVQSGLPLTNGRLLNRVDLGALYEFEMLANSSIPEGSSGVLRTGGEEYDIEIVARSEDQLVLFVTPTVDQLPGSPVQSATLVSDPWFLIERLRDRIHELAGSASPPSAALSALLKRLASRCPLPRAEQVHHVPPGLPLNATQEKAVAAALVEPVWFVWGPPGTGKTYTLGVLIAELAARGRSVVVLGPSNVAVDAALVATANELLARGKARLLEDGTVVRGGPSVMGQAQALRVSARERALATNPQLKHRLDDALRKVKSPGLRNDELAAAKSALANVRAEIVDTERRMLSDSKVVFCTLAKAALDEVIFGRRYDFAVVDEASMAFIPQVLFAASLAGEGVSLFGDFRQLPPIVVCESSSVQDALERDVFAGAGIANAVDHGKVPSDVTMLEEQHRMHPEIRAVVSDLSYLGRLLDGRRVVSDTSDLVKAAPAPGRPVVTVNTRFLGGRPWRTRDRSRANPMSAIWAVELALQALNTCAGSVAILSPYRQHAQLVLALVRELKLGAISVGTVHRMQGSEADAVIVDLVDGPPLGYPGQLLKGALGRRLINVALSRARGKLVVIGDPHLMHPHPDLYCGEVLYELKKKHTLSSLVATDSPTRAMTYIPAAEEEPDQYATDVKGMPCVAWIGSQAPAWTRPPVSLAPVVAPAQPDQAITIAGDVTWVLGGKPHGGWCGWRVASRRFADAVWDALGLAERRPLSPCPIHGVVTNVQCRGGKPVVECPKRGCTTRRSAGCSDLDLWALYYSINCSACGGHLEAKRGVNGLFYRCETCHHTVGACSVAGG